MEMASRIFLGMNIKYCNVKLVITREQNDSTGYEINVVVNENEKSSLSNHRDLWIYKYHVNLMINSKFEI